MRISYKIDNNTFENYKPSAESLALIIEIERILKSENFEWDSDHCPTLATLCANVLQKKFEKNPILDELPCKDRDYLLETISVNLPLDLVVPLIDDEIYWQRRYTNSYGIIKRPKPQQWTWKRLYLEKFMEHVIEQAQPEHQDEEDMQDITKLLCPYVKKLIISQLQHWKPPLHWDEEDIPEVHPIDHINFESIFKKLLNIEEFSLVYGMNTVGDTYKNHMFQLSVVDCQHLGKAIHQLKFLRIFRVHRSKLEDNHVRALMQGVFKNETIEELDLSHCEIGDQGALCIAKVLCVHPALKILNLCNNRIRTVGAEGIGFALLEPGCVLTKLDISLNPLKEGGTMGILRALVRGTQLSELSMSSCQMDEEATIRVGQMLKLNTSLKKLDVSNNWFDEEGGENLLYGLDVNRNLEWLDVRDTDITANQNRRIKQYLRRNRLEMTEIPDDVVIEEVEAEETVEDPAETTATAPSEAGFTKEEDDTAKEK